MVNDLLKPTLQTGQMLLLADDLEQEVYLEDMGDWWKL